MNELELEFQTEQINAKVKEASEALREAARLAKDAGLQCLIWSNKPGACCDEMSEDEKVEYYSTILSYRLSKENPSVSKEQIKELAKTKAAEMLKISIKLKPNLDSMVGAIADAGWNTSSWHC